MTDVNLADQLADRIADIAAALQSVLDTACEPGELAEASPATVAGPGLTVSANTDTGALWLAISPVAAEWPDWVQESSASSRERYGPLVESIATALGRSIQRESVEAALVENLGEALPDADRLSIVAVPIKSGDSEGRLWIGRTSREARRVEDRPGSPPRPAPTKALPPIQYADLSDGLRQLPPYLRSLLKIRVPVVVTLASTKQPVRKIVELGPGAIIQFNKSCEETLTVEVGGRSVAKGEAVKVGDKFGLRITSIVLPAERFHTVTGLHVTGGRADPPSTAGRPTPAADAAVEPVSR